MKHWPILRSGTMFFSYYFHFSRFQHGKFTTCLIFFEKNAVHRCEILLQDIGWGQGVDEIWWKTCRNYQLAILISFESGSSRHGVLDCLAGYAWGEHFYGGVIFSRDPTPMLRTKNLHLRTISCIPTKHCFSSRRVENDTFANKHDGKSILCEQTCL